MLTITDLKDELQKNDPIAQIAVYNYLRKNNSDLDPQEMANYVAARIPIDFNSLRDALNGFENSKILPLSEDVGILEEGDPADIFLAFGYSINTLNAIAMVVSDVVKYNQLYNTMLSWKQG